MSVSDTDVKARYQGNGSNTAFAIPFDYDAETEVQVYRRDETDPDAIVETLLVEGALQDYTLTGSSPPTTPLSTTVTFNSAPASTHKIMVRRRLALTQPTDYATNGTFPAETHESTVDRLCFEVQQVQEEVSRAVLFKKTTSQANMEGMPEPEALTVLRWNAGATALENKSIKDLGAIAAPATTVIGDLVAFGDITGEEIVSSGLNFLTNTLKIPSTSFTVVNNTDTETDVTGLLFDSTAIGMAVVLYQVRRDHGGSEILKEGGLLIANFNSGVGWDLTYGPFGGDAGMNFTIDSSTGQVKYTSSNLGGSLSVSTMKFSILSLGAI